MHRHHRHRALPGRAPPSAHRHAQLAQLRGDLILAGISPGQHTDGDIVIPGGPVPDTRGQGLSFLRLARRIQYNRRRPLAHRTVTMQIVDILFRIHPLGTIQNRRGIAQVLPGRAVIHAQLRRGAAAGFNPVITQNQPLAIDALVRIFCDKDVIRPALGHRPQELPVAGVEVLGFVDKHVVKHAFRARAVLHDVRGHHRRSRIGQLPNGRARRVEVLHNRPHRLALSAVERSPPPGAPRTQVGLLIRDPLREDHRRVLLCQKRRVGFLPRE